jgi:Arc/MetJ-type ribon-helix-helix transcriptional regulator
MSRRDGGTGDTGSPSGRSAGASADRRVRFTVDLSRQQHRFLKQFALDLEADASSVMRALLRLLEENDAVAKRVVTRVREGRTESEGS